MNMLSIFRALADPSRLRIMLLLQQMELAVGEIALVLGQSQPRVSRHVRILDEAGLAERRKEGSWVFLRPNLELHGAGAEDALARLLSSASAGGDEVALQTREDIARLQDVRAQREAQAAEYFAAHADNWDAIRSLYVAEAHVEAALTDMLDGEDLGHLLDVGTGTGRMVELFAPQIVKATAVDNSPEMLRLARAKLQHLEQGQVKLVQGDFNDLPLESTSYDTILLHQVLHYAQNPERVIAETGRVAASEGRIVIVDFASHDMEELRTKDAHARLGFSDTQIEKLLRGGGFALDRSRELSGGKLTVKIWIGVRSRFSLTPHDRSAVQSHSNKPTPKKAAA
ncbi:metalloregulator ArsR/SmtB family transcription factor [Sphingorhabdus sp. Alg239-R122]|uniref:ArsR/SmtB family transcription factor n=1 Tax=Sphingorhabdus sp. Alg239-R122 TaxID=2305989 RepID=UPI0013DB0858|nr:metalloregulator ArsR/SmtB family transcription factor [Sphingorhabdus sp. Alg239-R122]